MPSPDFSPYIDLTINDKQPDEIYEEAVDYARLALPEFSPRPGTIEDAILQATSYISALNLGQINRLPDGLMEGILRYMGVLRKEATFGSVDIEFELGEAGASVPAGTIAVYETTDGDVLVQYPFITTAIATAQSASVSVTTAATAQVAGILPNIPSGTTLLLAQPSSTVISATTASSVTQGARAETQQEYFERATTKLESLSSVLATAKQVENYILSEYPNVHRCKVYDLAEAVVHSPSSTEVNASKSGTSATVLTSSNFLTESNILETTSYMVLAPDFYGDSSTGAILPSGVYVGASAGSASIQYTDIVSSSGSVGPVKVISMESIETGRIGDSPGHFIIFVCDSVGNPLSDEDKTEIASDIEDRITAGLSFEILDAYPVDINFVVTISVDSSYGAGSVATNTANELESFISLPNWPNWDTTIRIFDVVVRANGVEGVSYVYSVTSSVPTHMSSGVKKGNEELVVEINDGANLIGYEILHLGVMPRASVEVVVV